MAYGSHSRGRYGAQRYMDLVQYEDVSNRYKLTSGTIRACCAGFPHYGCSQSGADGVRAAVQVHRRSFPLARIHFPARYPLVFVANLRRGMAERGEN